MNSMKSDKKYVVYKHTSPNNKVYIGITCKDPLARWAAGFGYQYNDYFWRAIVKYGWINFKHEILFKDLTEAEAKAKEVELIALYNTTDVNYGYNIDLGGDNHFMSEEARKNISEAKKGKRWSARRRLAQIKYVEHHRGRTVYKYNKEGKLVDTFLNVSLAAKDANIPTETMRHYLMKNYTPSTYKYVYSYGDYQKQSFTEYKDRNFTKAAVDMYDMSLNYIRTFNSIADAGRFLGINRTGHIPDVCKGKRLSSNGYIWRYHNENTDYKSA